MDPRLELEADRARAAQELVGKLRRVLPMAKQDPLLERDAGAFVAPNRKTRLEPEFDQGQLVADRRTQTVRRAERVRDLVVGVDADAIGEVIQEHRAAERRWHRGDQEPVEAPGDRAANRARRVAAEPVGHQPFAGARVPAALGVLRRSSPRRPEPAPRLFAARPRSPSVPLRLSVAAAYPTRGVSTTADSAGKKKPSSCSIGGVLGPP